MNKEKLSLIEKKIIDNKKRELSREVTELALSIRDKQNEIICNLELMDNEKAYELIKVILVESILNHKLKKPGDIYWHKEIEDTFLNNGIEEILNKQ
ncbi:MFS transporter [Bacillus wiedmannii]|uniref:MFS transporter n=1 Tax=Bacillus wiedmannii TaxID=1890302 RepID=UPI000D1713E3|nr:MFS transporter [Bacillus wiedmannii]PTC12247.1 MFS transporter [Bacillus wiedmannii]